MDPRFYVNTSFYDRPYAEFEGPYDHHVELMTANDENSIMASIERKQRAGILPYPMPQPYIQHDHYSPIDVRPQLHEFDAVMSQMPAAAPFGIKSAHYEYSQHVWQPATSPSNSGLESCGSGNSSDRQTTPYSSPQPVTSTYMREFIPNDHSLYGGDGHTATKVAASRHRSQPSIATSVSMDQVQGVPDFEIPNEDPTGTFHPTQFYSFPQEGYQPMPAEDAYSPDSDGTLDNIEVKMEDPPHDRRDSVSPVQHRRRRASSKVTRSPVTTSHRVHKSTHRHRPDNRSGYDVRASDRDRRAFPCALAPYGCEAAFGAKNEWKRHVNTQHMLLTYYRCDQCKDSKDFNRKDLFIQHVRRMHPIEGLVKSPTTSSRRSAVQASMRKATDAEQVALAKLAERCKAQSGLPPHSTCCVFCDEKFLGSAKWDVRLEHMGRHMEEAKKNGGGAVPPRDWRCDLDLERYLVEKEILVREGSKGRLRLAE